MTPQEVEGLARATLSHALIQLAVHFPQELASLDLSIPKALQHALVLAEEAIALAPNRADGHAALGRLLLCHEDEHAVAMAIEVLHHALSLDAEHDPAEIAYAVALAEQGNPDGAREAVGRVLKRGNGLPQPLMLRALLSLEAGQVDAARRDIERAVSLAPMAGLIRLDASAVAEVVGDLDAAERHQSRARELLGPNHEEIVGFLNKNI